MTFKPKMVYDLFKTEKDLQAEGYLQVIGIDEAGRGPLAGPVVAAAACFKYLAVGEPPSIEDKKLFNLIRDSKTLSEKQRERAFDFINAHFHIGIGLCDHKTIDRVNILEATYLAMKKAIASLNYKLRVTNDKQIPKAQFQNPKSIILVDGNRKIPNISIEQRTIVSGDSLVKSISAASVVAKVTRDRLMREMDLAYPGYGFCDHKGYGTKLHLEKLGKLGPCEIHRRSFYPVSACKD